MSESPTFGRWLREQRGAAPGARKLWSPLEDAQLAAEVAAGVEWKDIALRHGRSVHAVQQRHRRAVRGE